GRAEADPVVTAIVAALGVHAQRRSLAALLVLVVDLDAAPAGLTREAPDPHLAGLHEPRVHRARQPVPLARIPGVGIRRDALDGGLRLQVAVAPVEPQPVAQDRA